MNTLSEQQIDEWARILVPREVMACVSQLVYDLSTCGYHSMVERTLNTLTDEAQELCYPVRDCEEAARAAGWTTADLTQDMKINEKLEGDEEGQCASFEGSWEELCDEYSIDTDEFDREVYEHWIVSDWLKERLEERGERVGELAGLTVWGRTTTGQAIYCDHVIRQIAIALHTDEVTP